MLSLASICPALFENLTNLLGIHKLAALGLRKPPFDLCGNSLTIGQHPILILLLNDGEGLIEHFFRAHAGTRSLIKYLLLLGFEFEDHRALHYAAR